MRKDISVATRLMGIVVGRIKLERLQRYLLQKLANRGVILTWENRCLGCYIDQLKRALSDVKGYIFGIC